MIIFTLILIWQHSWKGETWLSQITGPRPQIAYIGGPPKTRQFFRSHPPADSQRIRWWDAGKMAIGLCHVPLAESAQTASGWASGHGRHAGGFRSRQARQWRATGVAPADFIRTRRSQAWPASSPTIHYTGCLNYPLFFPCFLFLLTF